MAVATRSASCGRNTQTRCHSVFEVHSSCAFFHERCVATESTVNFEPSPFARRCSGSEPTNPTRVIELIMWNRAGSPARRIVGFGPRGGRTQNGGSYGPGVYDLRSPVGAVSEGFKEPSGERVVGVPSYKRARCEHYRGIRTRLGCLSRLFRNPKHTVSFRRSPHDRSLHPQHR